MVFTNVEYRALYCVPDVCGMYIFPSFVIVAQANLVLWYRLYFDGCICHPVSLGLSVGVIFFSLLTIYH